jgi:transcriptional regulator with XRE-family HTH domain
MIGDRIQQARKAASLSQEELSKVLGFNDRQILSNIEAGKRKVSADELVRFVESLEKPLEYFTDPFLISDDGAISWRTEASGAVLTEFETWATTLIGSQRRLAQMLNEKISPLRFHLPLTTKSSYEDVWNKAEALVDMWSLGKDLSKGFRAKRAIYDYVFTDSANERTFVTELDASTEVVVYAKLPKSFFIPTPVGNYNPDWAIAFEQAKVKHIYFIAETKGSMSTMDLREIENCKINCARKFFAKITSDQVKYDVVNSYGKLMELVK